MCELLGVTAKKKIRMNDFLKDFFSHSIEHRNGWGLAFFDDTPIYIEKEPVKAADSITLKSRLENSIRTSRCIAHIRKATIGEINFENTHPFSKRDDSGRMWVLAHNGTIFDSEILVPYQYIQNGTTDSERILLYIVHQMNRFYEENAKEPGSNERIHIIDEAVQLLTPGNKVNLMIYDGKLFYVHKNEPGTMYMKEDKDGVFFSTQPLETYGWKEVPQNRLLVYLDGELVYFGPEHSNTYIHDESKMRLLYFAYSNL